MVIEPDPSTPVLVGCGDVTDLHTPAEAGRSPYVLIAQAARLALQDVGAAGMAEAIDTVAMIRSFADTSPRFATKLGTSTNPPRSVARVWACRRRATSTATAAATCRNTC